MNITSLTTSIFDPLGPDIGPHIFTRSINNNLIFRQHLKVPRKPILISLLTRGLFRFQMSDNMILGNLPDGKDCKVLGNQCHVEGLGTQAGYSAPCIMVDERTVLIQDITDTEFFSGCQATLYNLSGGNGPTILTGIVRSASVDDTLNATLINFTDIFTTHTNGFIALNSNFQSHAEGENTVASGKNSHAGGKGAVADLPSKFSRSDSYFYTPGDGQYSSVVCGVITTNDTPVLLTIDGKIIKIRYNMSYMFVAMICARSSAGGKNVMFLRYGIIKNVDGVIALEGSIQTLGTDINFPNWFVDITADDINGLQIEVTGEGDEEVHWKCHLDCVEIG